MRDDAITTAREILHKLVCECGHIESEHLRIPPPPDTCHGSETCRCQEFRPVTFVVKRRRR